MLYSNSKIWYLIQSIHQIMNTRPNLIEEERHVKKFVMAVHPGLIPLLILWLMVLGSYYRTNPSDPCLQYSPFLGIPLVQPAERLCTSLVHNFTAHETRLCMATQKAVHDSSSLVCTGAHCWQQYKLSPTPSFACSNEQNPSCTRWRVCGQDSLQHLNKLYCINSCICVTRLSITDCTRPLQSAIQCHVKGHFTASNHTLKCATLCTQHTAYINKLACYNECNLAYKATNNLNVNITQCTATTHPSVLLHAHSPEAVPSLNITTTFALYTILTALYLSSLVVCPKSSSFNVPTLLHPKQTHFALNGPQESSLNPTNKTVPSPSYSLRTCPLCNSNMPKVKPHLTVCAAVPPLPEFNVKFVKPYSSRATIPSFSLQGPLPPQEEALYTEPGTFRLWKNIYWTIGACHDAYIVDIFLQFYLIMKNPHSYPVSVNHCKLKPYIPPSMYFGYFPFTNTYLWAYCKFNLSHIRTIFILYAEIIHIQAIDHLATYLTPFIITIYLFIILTQYVWMFYKLCNYRFLFNFPVLYLSKIVKQLTKFVNFYITFNKKFILYVLQIPKCIYTWHQFNFFSIIKLFIAPTTPSGPRGQRLLLPTVCESLVGRRVGLFVAARACVGFNKQFVLFKVTSCPQSHLLTTLTFL